jgi:hypothetical protein
LGRNLYCCYYFKEINQILVNELGSGLGSMYTNLYSLINFNEKKIFYLYKFNNYSLDDYIYNKILVQKNKINDMEDNEFINNFINKPPINLTIYGYQNNLGHQIFNDFTGIYLLQQSEIFKKTNKIFIGPYDSIELEKYFKFNYPDIEIVKENTNNISEFDNYIGKGIIYKYNDHFVSNKMRIYFYESIKNNTLYTNSKEFENILNKLQKPDKILKLLIVLRCGSRDMIDQAEVLVEFIKNVKNKYPDSQIILSGFTNINNQNSEADLNDLKIGYFNQSYNEIKDKYLEISKKIIDNIESPDIININDFNFRDSYLITKECNLAIYQHGSASTTGCWLCNIPGIEMGFHDPGRYIWMDKVINQENNLNYLNDKEIIEYDKKEDHIYNFKIINNQLFFEYFDSFYTNIKNNL